MKDGVSAEEYDLSQIDDDDEELQQLFRDVSDHFPKLQISWLVCRHGGLSNICWVGLLVFYRN